MKFSANDCQALLPELQALCGRRVQQGVAHACGQALLLERGAVLYWGAQAGTAVCFVQTFKPVTLEATAFVMLLRKHLSGARLVSVAQLQSDRLLELAFQRGPEQSWLMLELTGRHANIFLLDAQRRLLGHPRRDHSRERTLHIGQSYTPPRPPRRQPPPSALLAQPADGSRSQTLRAHWEDFCRYHQHQQQQQALRQHWQQLSARLRREIAFQEQQLTQAEEAPVWRQRGELLQGGWQHWQPGATEVRVINYLDPRLSEIEVPLDPARDLAANIAHCFARARRLERTARQAEARLLQLWEQQAHLEKLNPEHLTAADLPAIDPPERRPAKPERQPWRVFWTARGEKIRVGKTDRDNDTLLRRARGNELWLHLRNGSGAHVVITQQEPLASETLLDGAALAQHYSSQTQETRVEVVWTQVKYLQRTGAPGQVALRQSRVLTYQQEPERLARLLASRQRSPK